jgi:aquaporin TIP
MALAIMVYATAHISGGHLNPAVSFALAFTKHISWMRCWVFTFAQIIGAIFGSLVAQGLVPSDHLWQNYKSKSIRSATSSDSGSGCFFPNNGASHGQVFGWETVTTFMLVIVVYCVAVTKPGHGNMGPLVVGLTLFCSAIAAGPYCGASLNPARFLAPATIFGCSWQYFHLYIFGEYFGAFLAALTFYLFFSKVRDFFRCDF